ncbi:MAG: hypothetical protein AB8I08_21190 [Sandaracinaceae bacterium]
MSRVLERCFHARGDAWPALLFVLLGALGVAGFWDAATLHGGYAIESRSIRGLPPREVHFLFWYAVWGTFSAAMFGAAFARTKLVPAVTAFLRDEERGPKLVVLGGGFVFFVALGLRHGLLQDQPVTDDEGAYDFIAQTLLRGRIVNPLPEGDPAYFANQFIVIGESGWFGKYALGHGVLLAPFALIGRLDLAGPLFAVGTYAAAWFVGRAFFGPRRAVLGAALLALSPHFLATHATRLSQTSSGLALLLALLGALHLTSRGGRGAAALTGLALAAGVIIRPLPGGLFVVLVGAALFLMGRLRALPTERRVPFDELALMALVASLGVAGVLATNHVQSGSIGASGYDTLHGGVGGFHNIDGAIANSIAGALVRENVWLFGWSLSLVFLPFARPRRAPALFWAGLVALLIYRLVFPKTVVSTTGPIYLTEGVPLLAYATADGMGRARLALKDRGRWVGALALAGFLVGAVTFWPVVWRAISAGASQRAAVLDRLPERDVLVFANLLMRPEESRSWAVYPPVPGPALNDPRVFLRVDTQPGGTARAWQLWRARFPDRRAFFFAPLPGGRFAFTEWDPAAPPGPSDGS